MEWRDVVLSRTHFLSIKQYREQKKPIVHLDETWIDSNWTFGNCWQTNDVFGVIESGNASRQIIILCAGGDMGLLPHSSLLYTVSSSSWYYHGQMNSMIFEKWTAEKIMSNF